MKCICGILISKEGFYHQRIPNSIWLSSSNLRGRFLLHLFQQNLCKKLMKSLLENGECVSKKSSNRFKLEILPKSSKAVFKFEVDPFHWKWRCYSFMAWPKRGLNIAWRAALKIMDKIQPEKQSNPKKHLKDHNHR